MEKYILISLILLQCSFISAQEKSIAQNFEVEASFFYYWESDNIFGAYYNELSLSPSFTVNITEQFYLGLRSYIVRGKSKISPVFSEWHTLLGPVARYKLINKERIELNIEGGYFFGNYCPNCFPDDEYFKASIHYVGVAVDFNFQIVKAIPQLWLKASFATNNPINIKELHGYNLPLIGIQYKFGKLETN